MNFVFPSNYNFKNKLFGLIDYTTAIINVVWYIFSFCLVNLIFSDLNFRILVFSTLTIPFLIFSIINNRNENLLIVLTYIFKFLCSPKLYFYRKY